MTLPSPGTCSATSNGASLVRTVESSRCHVSSSGTDAIVVRDLGEQVQVRPRRVRVELVGRARGDAHRLDGSRCARRAGPRAGGGTRRRTPCHSVRSATGSPESTGRQVGVAHLERVRRDEAHPWRAGELDRRVAGHVVGADDVGMDVVPDLHDPFVRVPLAGDERLPDRLRHGLDLLDRRLAELGSRDADELRPRVGGRIGGFLGRRHPHHPLLEPAACRARRGTTRRPRTRRGGPRSRRTFAIATQLFVGPQAPGSGKKAKVVVWSEPVTGRSPRVVGSARCTGTGPLRGQGGGRLLSSRGGRRPISNARSATRRIRPWPAWRSGASPRPAPR